MTQEIEEVRNCIVYRHIRLDRNEPFYIGISSNKVRPYEKSKTSRSSEWYQVFKDCKKQYRVDILFDSLTFKEACEKEIEFIELYGRRDLNLGPLVNLTKGGQGINNLVFNEERNLRLSEIQKNAEKFKCEWCEIETSINLLTLWHNDNCKHNPNYVERERSEEISICPYCLKEDKISVLRRYHFDNCKLSLNFTPREYSILECPWCKLTGPNIGSGFKIAHFDFCKQNPNRVIGEWRKCEWCGREGESTRSFSQFHFENCLKNPSYQGKMIECPWCGKVGSNRGSGMIKSHFDNCPKNPDYVEKEREVLVCSFCKVTGVEKRSFNKNHGLNCKNNPDRIKKEKLTCPYCNLSSTYLNVMRDKHFDNCKLKPKLKENV